MISIDSSKGLSPKAADYIKNIKAYNNKTDALLFNNTISNTAISSSSYSIVAFEDENTVGVLGYKQITLNKHDYLLITMFNAQSDEAYSELIKAFLYKYNKSSTDGVFTELFPNSDAKITSHFSTAKFNKYESVYICEKAVLLNKLSNRSSVNGVIFKSTNRSQYSKLFSDLLIEYDNELAKDRNDTLKHVVFKTNLSSSRNQRIRISYFINTLIKSNNWFSMLLFDESNDDQEPIGFIKCYIDYKSNICYPDVYIKPKYYAKYAEASFYQFTKNAPASNLAFIITKSNKSLTSVLERWLGNSLGNSYSIF